MGLKFWDYSGGLYQMVKDSKNSSKKIIEKFLSLSWPEFIQSKKGLIFIKDNVDLYKFEQYGDGYTDKTGCESSINHIHMNDVIGFKAGKDFKKIIRLVGDIWACKLKNEFPNHRFRIYLTYEDDFVIRFHQIHESEPYWLNESDWQEKISKGEIVIWDI